MRVCKNILHLLSIFVIFLSLPLFSQSYSSVDFNRLILNHPMMKNFDPLTGRFKNTPSEIVPIQELKRKLEALKLRISSINEDKKQSLKSIFLTFNRNGSEENTWNQINQFDQSIAALKDQLDHTKKLLSDLGIPGYETVLAVTRNLYLETRKSIHNQSDIVLNLFPRFPLPEKPDFGKISLRTVFRQNDEKKLTAYLENKSLIGMLFNKVYQPILFNDQEEKQE